MMFVYTRGPLMFVYVYMGTVVYVYVHEGPPCVH